MSRVRVVLADDHVLFREALRDMVVSRLPGVEVVGEASTGVETLMLCRQLDPEVLVLDLSMPGLGGLEVLTELRSSNRKIRVLVVSQYTDRPYVIRALKLGAKGYVTKKALAKDLVGAMQTVIEGRTYIDPSVVDLVVDEAMNPSAGEPQELRQLTVREREVLKLIAESRTSKEIAADLGISHHTVNRHRANLMEKLDLHSRADLVKLAIRLGMIDV